jgi:lipopolysaccharide/colanic/teichoic acid biosynthesis glycosyltransferase
MNQQNNHRFFDIIVAILLLIILLPVSFISIIISFIELKTSPFYTQRRGLTFDGKLFNIYKIRTVDENPKGHETIERKFLQSPGLVEKVPRICRILRITGFDELPQLINVLKGEMSIVGPRPLDLFDLQFMKDNHPELHKMRLELKSKPGILGLWQLYGKRELGAKNLLEWDLCYEKNKNVFLDIKILFNTLFHFLSINKSKEDSIFTKKS